MIDIPELIQIEKSMEEFFTNNDETVFVEKAQEFGLTKEELFLLLFIDFIQKMK